MDSRTLKKLLFLCCSGFILCFFLAFPRIVFPTQVSISSDIVQHNPGSKLLNLTFPLFTANTSTTSSSLTTSVVQHFSTLAKLDSTPVPLHTLKFNWKVPVSKDAVVHSAYFDPRPRDNHKNVTVIFLNVNKTILDKGWVVGCGVDGRNATAFTMHSVFENELMHNWLGKKPFKYENMLTLCYDMPGRNGSEVYVFYKTGPNSREIKQTSQHPLFVPAPRVTPTGKYNFTTVTCSKIHNRGVTFFREFVQYQRTLGVDHVHVNILDLFITDKGFEDLVVKDPYLWGEYSRGYLTFTVWKEWYEEGKWNDGDVYLHSEVLRKLECIYRFIGTYDFAMPLDTDDFFVPRVPGLTKLKDYILQYCYSKPAGTCRFQWVWHYPKCGLEGEITDGNVTKHLKTKVYNPNEAYNFKSVHSTKAILDASFHDARCPKCLKPGYILVHIPTHVGYVAHNRYAPFVGRSPCQNKGPLL